MCGHIPRNNPNCFNRELVNSRQSRYGQLDFCGSLPAQMQNVHRLPIRNLGNFLSTKVMDQTRINIELFVSQTGPTENRTQDSANSWAANVVALIRKNML